MKSRKRVLASALAAASLAVGSKADGFGALTFLEAGAGLVAIATVVMAAKYFVDYLMTLSSKYESVDKEEGITGKEKEEIKGNCVDKAVEALASSISVGRGGYLDRYLDVPEGFLKVSCGGQNWFVCFVKDGDKGGFAALCGKQRFQLLQTVKGLKCFENHFNNDYDLVLNKDGLSEQIKEFTRCVVNSLSPTASENFKNAVCEGLYPVMLDKVWNTFSEGQVYFAASSDQASAIVEAAKCNYDNFALSMD